MKNTKPAMKNSLMFRPGVYEKHQTDYEKLETVYEKLNYFFPWCSFNALHLNCMQSASKLQNPANPSLMYI